jgi:transposase-like protein
MVLVAMSRKENFLLPYRALAVAMDGLADAPNDDWCIHLLASLRWRDGIPVCPSPACQGKQHYYLNPQKRWKCKHCHRRFPVTVGTIFQGSRKVSLGQWLAMLLLVVSKEGGISTYEVARRFGLTQKYVWSMTQRIRIALKISANRGIVNPVNAGEGSLGKTEENAQQSKLSRAVGTSPSLIDNWKASMSYMRMILRISGLPTQEIENFFDALDRVLHVSYLEVQKYLDAEKTAKKL